MFRLDMRTALFSFMLISLMSTLLSALLVKQFSRRYKGVYHLFFCFLLQVITLLLILLRGTIPDWLSFDVSNSISIGGIILFLIGIEKYSGQKSSLKTNLVLLVFFIAIHTWFTFVQPDLSIRHLNVSAAWLLLFFQTSVLLLFRIPRSGVGRIFPLTLTCIAFCVVCVFRIIKFIVWGHSDDYFQSDQFDIIIIVISEILLILLMFSLSYLFGGRLFDDIRAEEQKFSKIFHTSPFAILLSRLSDGKIIEANKVFFEKTGYTPPEIMGKTTSELGLWEDYKNRASLVSELEDHEKVRGKEILVKTKTGNTVTGLLTSELLAVNDEVCIFSSFEDITDRKKIEKEKNELFRSLAESEEKCRSFFVNSFDANFITSPDGTVFSANPAACRMLGYTEKEICSLGREHLVDMSDPRLAAALAERNTKGRFSGELTMIRKNGEKFPVELSSVIFSRPDGKKMTSMIVRDITQKKHAEEEQQKSREMLENLNQHLIDARENERKNIAMALHDDLGQRLTGLYLDIAWLKKKLKEQPVSVMKKIDQHGKMILDTIENVKETSAFLRPAILFELGLIPAILSHLKKFEKKSGVNCRFACNPDHLELDERTSLVIYRIFQESVTNIARHSRAGNIEVNLNLSENVLKLTIRDDGKGITGDQVNSPGSMGLAGMRERIKSVNGKLDISGEDGQGTIISVMIPYNKGKTI